MPLVRYPAQRAINTSRVYSLNFTALGANEDPLSQGGIWTNNTQGTGGNAAMNTQTSVRVALSTDTTTRIAQNPAAAQANYDDAFAFVPGFAGNQRITATVYKESGYAPTDGHEIQLWVGATVYGNDNKRAVECLWGINGSGTVDIVLQDGVAGLAGFTVLGFGSGAGTGVMADGDAFKAELDRAAKTIKWWRNSTLMAEIGWTTTNGAIDATVQGKLNALGSGVGLAVLRRAGDTSSGKLGFRDVLIESF